MHDNKTHFHINAFALTGRQITVIGHWLTQICQFIVRLSMRLTARWIWDLFCFHKSKIFEFLSLQKLKELEKEEELREAAGLYDSEPVRECHSNFWIIIIILITCPSLKPTFCLK